MNDTKKIPLKSRISPNATGYHGNSVTSPIEAYISTITANFGRNCQNILNFAARVGLDAAQKISITTAVDRSLLGIQGGQNDA
jgi:hypothetical protein